MGENTTSPEQKKLYNLYAIFGVAKLTSVMPFASAAVVCVVFFIWILAAAYIARGKAEDGSLVHNHAVYIVRTLWIGAFFSVLSMVAASFYMLGAIDYSPFDSCANTIANQNIDGMKDMSTQQFFIEPCVEPFITFNKVALASAAVIGLVPPLLYLSYRFIKGVSRAVKGYRLAKPRAWF